MNDNAPDFIPDDVTDQDPQSAVAAQGMQQLGQQVLASQPVQNVITGAPLQTYQNTLNAAMAGDPAAANQISNTALGTAMGTIAPVEGAAAALIEPKAAGYIGNIEKSKQLLDTLGEGGANVSQDALNAAAQRRSFEILKQDRLKRGMKRYAEGGDVSPDFIPDTAPQSGTVSAPNSMNSDFIPDSEFIADEDKYGTGEQQLKAGLEGAAQGIAGPAAPYLEKKLLGVTDEDIQGRKEENPGTHLAGEVAGLGASMLSGLGVGSAAIKAGELAGHALPAATSLGMKIGSAAAKSAIENAVISGSDELAKMVISDPSQTAGTAAVDIGLSGLLGGAIGSVAPIWTNTLGGKLGSFLKSVSDRTGGIEGKTSDAVNDAVQTLGMDIKPEMRSALSNDEGLQKSFQQLSESSTGSGEEVQASLKNFKQDLSNQVIESLGHTPESIANLGDLSEYDAGKDVANSLKDELKQIVTPISEKFNTVTAQFKDTPLTDSVKGDIAEQLGNLSNNEGYNLSSKAPQSKILSQVLEEIQPLKNLEQLRKYGSLVNDMTSNPELYRVGGQIRRILRDAEEGAIDAGNITSDGLHDSEAIGLHREARSQYRDAMNMIDDLNDRLHVGKFNGPDSFIKAIGEMAPEDVIRRLSPHKDAGLLEMLQSKFPSTVEQIRKFQLDRLLKKAADKAGEGEAINSKVFYKGINDLSPQMRNFIVPEQAAAKLEAVHTILEALPSKMNTSGTAKTLDALWSKIPASVSGMIAAMGGHNPISGFIFGHLGKLLSRDVPDAAKLAMLKFMGSSQPIESTGFKAMFDYMNHVVKGEMAMNKSVSNLFKGIREAVPESLIPSERDRSKLDKIIDNLHQNQEPLLNMTNDLNHYVPDHAQVVSATSMAAVNFLQALKPKTQGALPLDPKREPSSVETAKYNNALNIAQQPLVVIDKLNKGTLTPDDLVALKTMHPGVYSRLAQKMTEQVANTVSKGDAVPYKLKIGMSMFLGQPLDSTMTPQAIMNAQPQMQQQAPQQSADGQSAKHSTSNLNKISTMYQTPGQARQQHLQKE